MTDDPEQTSPGEGMTPLTEADRLVRKTAFVEILATGRPWDPASATDLGIPAASIRTAVDDLVEAGRVRTDEQGRVTAAAGLSTEPTAHHILVGFDPRWTNCAYDALGILGALGADGVIAARSPSTGAAIHVLFERVDRSARRRCCSSPISRVAAGRTRTGART